MLGICSTCGNHEWDKEVEGNKIDRLAETCWDAVSNEQVANP